MPEGPGVPGNLLEMPVPLTLGSGARRGNLMGWCLLLGRLTLDVALPGSASCDSGGRGRCRVQMGPPRLTEK